MKTIIKLILINIIIFSPLIMVFIDKRMNTNRGARGDRLIDGNARQNKKIV